MICSTVYAYRFRHVANFPMTKPAYESRSYWPHHDAPKNTSSRSESELVVFSPYSSHVLSSTQRKNGGGAGSNYRPTLPNSIAFCLEGSNHICILSRFRWPNPLLHAMIALPLFTQKIQKLSSKVPATSYIHRVAATPFGGIQLTLVICVAAINGAGGYDLHIGERETRRVDCAQHRPMTSSREGAAISATHALY